MRVKEVDRVEAMLNNRHRAVAKRRLEDNYKKAQKRAQKKGRELPPRDDAACSHWGYPYMMYGPWVYPACYCPGLYYGSDPGALPSGTGTAGACVAGTCGGSSAAGACAGPGAGQCSAGGAVSVPVPLSTSALGPEIVG